MRFTGGTLRVHLQHPGARPIAASVVGQIDREMRAGLGMVENATPSFAERVRSRCIELPRDVRRWRAEGRRVAAYGAPAKGSTLLNVCGLTANDIDFTVDVSPHKQGRLMPGSRIPILAPSALLERMPDLTLLLPWNLAPEILAAQRPYLRAGGAFAIPFPSLRLVREADCD